MSVSDRVTVTKTDKFTIFGKSTKLLPADSVPAKRTLDSVEVAAEISQLPKGKAIALTAKDIDIKLYSMKVKIDGLQKQGLIPKNFITTLRKASNGEVLYIVNPLPKSEE
jgi:hypothetical protein